MDVSAVPVFLSDKGLRAAEQVFERRNAQSDRPAPEDYERARIIVFDSDWGDYDDVYVALYTLRLTGGKWLPRRDFERGPRPMGRTTAQIDCVLDLTVEPDYANKWLINEWVVADIIDFRLTMGRLLPAQSALVYVGFGCFMMSLQVSLGSDDASSISGRRLASPAEAAGLLRDYLAASGIDDIRHRFGVSTFEISAGV